MGILMAGLSPHPPLIIPEIGGEEISEVEETVEGLEELAGEIKSCQPDLLITISPHGSVFKDAISVLDLARLSGDFTEFGRSDLKLEVDSLPEFIEDLTDQAEKNQLDIIRLDQKKSYNYNISIDLDHGALVPLYFLDKVGLNIPVVALTMGLMDYDQLYKFGSIIDKTLTKSNKDAVILASGDLSHRLKPGAPAGYNPKGEEFDQRLVGLLERGEFEEILDIDPRLIEKAGECGLRPLIMALGSLQNYKINTELKSYQGPMGVGYAVAGFYPEEGEDD